MVAREDIQALADEIAEKFPEVERVILFGSHAYGTPHEHSDVDLMVLMPTDDRRASREAVAEAVGRPGIPVDIKVFDPAEAARRFLDWDPVVRHALERGLVLRRAIGEPRLGFVVQEWLDSADQDYEVMEVLASQDRPFSSMVCFHAQQCVEKLMKAVLIAAGRDAPRTHELADLAARVGDAHSGWSWDGAELADLTKGAVLFRYPEVPPTPEDAARLADVCRRVRPTLLALVPGAGEQGQDVG